MKFDTTSQGKLTCGGPYSLVYSGFPAAKRFAKVKMLPMIDLPPSDFCTQPGTPEEVRRIDH